MTSPQPTPADETGAKATRSRNTFGRRAMMGGALAGLAGGALAAAKALSVAGDADGPDPQHVLNRLMELPADNAVFIALDARGGPTGAIAGLHRLSRAVDAASDALEVGLALGPSYFQAAGLSSRTPKQLVKMPAFPGDLLRQDQSDGDVLIQIGARTNREARAGMQRLVTEVPHWTVRWRIDAFRPNNRKQSGQALTQNQFGYTEGMGNPKSTAEATARALVRSGDGEPDWAVGGSYQVLRHIQLATRLWEADPPEERDRIIGRHRDGRWLDGTPADETPNFAADPQGKITPLDSHVRLANPRIGQDPAPPIVRRSYSYTHSTGDAEAPDAGLLFICYQRSLADGFTQVQQRLAGGTLNEYTLTTGGGYYFVPPLNNSWLQQLSA